MDYSSPANLIIASVYYLATGILSFFSIIGVYILLRYGKSRILSFFIGIIYAIFILTILANSYSNLQKL